MTYSIYGLENTRARICAKRAQVSCKTTADMIAAAWQAEDLIVVREEDN